MSQETGVLNLPVVIQHIDFPFWCLSVFICSVVLKILSVLCEALSDQYVFSDVMPAWHSPHLNQIASG